LLFIDDYLLALQHVKEMIDQLYKLKKVSPCL